MSDNTGAAQAAVIGIIADDQHGLVLGSRLAAVGCRVLFHNLSAPLQSALSPNLEIGVTPADIAIECAVIVLAIDDTSRIRHLLLGAPDRAGLMHDLAPGTLVIDTGVRLARETQAILGILGTRGVGLVDAALIGAPQALASGTMTVFAGGYPDALEDAEPVLSHFGRVQRTGPLGSAQTAAALMGYVEAAHVTARSEALAVGRALGLSPETLARVLQDAPDDANIVRLNRRADLVRSIATEKGLGADIIAFERRSGPRSSGENR
jgi:3-hydroxyisobutyrate dehydrogenase